ncbi:MAG: ABC transporter permease [Bacteroidetes bacterium]|nr:ABC transporter permease [Bacteroidota bacterium]
MKRYIYTLNIAIEAVFLNKSRSLLTALGIIFGVAAVISMMAIGSGAKKEILDQIKLVGVNNIIVKPKLQNKKNSSSQDKNSTDQQSEGKKDNEKFSPGLTLKDAESIKNLIPTVRKVSPEVNFETFTIKDGVRSPAKLTGVTPDFFDMFGLGIQKGQMFTREHLELGKAVCLIGPMVKTKLFKQENPVGQHIKCGHVWLEVIGVLDNRDITSNATENLDINDYNNTIFAPIQTLLLRFQNRSTINPDDLGGEDTFIGDGYSFSFSSGGEEASNMNELDKITVQVKESEMIGPTTDLIKKMILRRHSGVEDFEIKVPELLLKQEQRTKEIFNIVLGVIAGISLLVGGIGIMNIMLASVMERTKEIGIRMAMGATRKDVVVQFLMEATLISLTGGIIGIILGITLSKGIMQITGILTIVSLFSIVLSFGVAASVGILFGYMPAKRAASADPVESLRYE